MTTLSERITVQAAIREAIEHGHPDWSHLVAYGPCRKPSRFAHLARTRSIGRAFAFTARDMTGALRA